MIEEFFDLIHRDEEAAFKG